MKLCVFSDIHGNADAFRAALPLILAEKADLNVFLGDLCGYYFEEVEVFEALGLIPDLVAVIGNHDQMFLKAAAGDQEVRAAYLAAYGPALENFLKKSNGGELLRWLSQRPEEYLRDDLGLACHHANPWGRTVGYVYPDADLSRFRDFSSANFFIGHTHYPTQRLVDGKFVFNPGSLGQPRRGGWPTYAVVELPQRQVQLREVRYDKAPLLAAIDRFKPDKPYLREVLLREPQ